MIQWNFNQTASMFTVRYVLLFLNRRFCSIFMKRRYIAYIMIVINISSVSRSQTSIDMNKALYRLYKKTTWSDASDFGQF